MVTSHYIEDLNDRAIGMRQIAYTLDLAGFFTFIDPEGQRLSGYSSEEVARMNVTEIVAPELVEVVRKQIARTIKRRVGVVYQIEIITKDRRRIPLETSMHVVMRDGRPIEIQGIALPPIGILSNARRRCVDSDFALDLILRL